ncbi:MAG: site-2 protease family protein [Roseimicrobium sp.]
MKLETLAFLAVTVLFGNVLAALCSVVFWMLARAKGFPISQVQFLYGPCLRLLQISGTKFTLGIIPYGSSVLYDIVQFRQQPLLWRCAVVLSGPGLLILFALSTLGAEAAWSHFLSGFQELLTGPLHPLTTAQHLIAELHHIFDQSLLQMAGVIAAKIAAFSLIPGLGPAFVQILREIIGRDENEDRTLNTILTVHVLILFVISLLWAYSIVHYAVN